MLLLHPRAKLGALFPSAVLSYREAEGENVWMKVPEAEAFDGLEPLDLCWFQTTEPAVPRACSGTYRVAIDQALPAHNSLPGQYETDYLIWIRRRELFVRAFVFVTDGISGFRIAIYLKYQANARSLIRLRHRHR